MEILDRHQETLVTRERALVESLMEYLIGFGAPSGDIDLLRQTLSDMGDPFLFVVVGEFNAGKSAFINALLGEEVAEEGSLPTTNRITVLKHGPEPTMQEGEQGIMERRFPSELLHAISVVDTPGTNTVIRQHEQLSREFVPRSDLVLFITSAERPFTESEREYMELIRDWGKKIVLVVNKVDVLHPQEVDEMRRFVTDQVRALLGLAPPVFMVSTRRAQQAKTATEPERSQLMKASGFDELEGYVSGLMGQKDLVNLKLQSPLGVVEELVRRYRGASDERANLLEEDVKMVRSLQSSIDSYREETRRDFDVRLAQLELVVNEINERADAWFEENSGLKSSFGFLRRDNLQERFRAEVVAGTGELIDRRVRELINWLVYRNVKQWRTIIDYVELHRKAELIRRLTGEIADDFVNRREELLRSISDNATSMIENYDYKREAERLAKSLREAVTQTAAREMDTLGFETRTRDMATAEASDITGTTMAVLVTGLELSARPGRKARSEFREQTNALRKRLNEAVKRQLEAELEYSTERMRETVIPYDNFVNTELRRMKTAESILEKLGGSVKTIGNAVESQTAETG